MIKNLPQGIKISISRSITTSFEKYMEKIEWKEDKFNLPQFVEIWRDYITNSASWYKQLSVEQKNDPELHEDLAKKINEIIEKTFAEPPTSSQIEEIDALQKELKTDYEYSCKAEARYVLNFLKNKAE
ncbi:hypothetical protein FZC79_10880 [Rossellomorea vietnamensis]|uniref:Group-specific protein n=1 Tax=Rossellomorea vietnamensis TaxID=218284 RepID=A0A5D4KEL9_9BACI|nr:hypothetical protein [Rossellomorea vietnamensis]TYR75260.1 hypothetical protein FZC79_10880 [Rossellomorea vietnamensis]